jgi:hypothetical protein
MIIVAVCANCYPSLSEIEPTNSGMKLLSWKFSSHRGTGSPVMNNLLVMSVVAHFTVSPAVTPGSRKNIAHALILAVAVALPAVAVVTTIIDVRVNITSRLPVVVAQPELSAF